MGNTITRDYFPGMGQAVADRTINRKIDRHFAAAERVQFVIARSDKTSLEKQVAIHAESQGYLFDNDFFVEHGDDKFVSGYFWATGRKEVEKWADVAIRVATGNAMLDPRVDMKRKQTNAEFAADPGVFPVEFDRMHHHLSQASLLMSGRHLQHGDETQPSRNMEVFTNCSTAANTFLLFYLLLNGSGVGRAYDDAMIQADLNDMPIVVCAIDYNHQDVQSGLIKGYPTRRDAEHLYAGRKVTVFDVPDSREGWAKAIEVIERMAFEKRREEVLILEFTGVRPRNAPIMGMQGRPASGPGPLMSAIVNIAKLRDAGMDPWRAAMYADHYAAECVLVGGARRAARMATKYWRDRTVLDFIQVKRGGFLWSSNNSVTVDQDFRDGVKHVREMIASTGGTRFLKTEDQLSYLLRHRYISFDEAHAYRVLIALAEAAYQDGTGEPGIINQDRLTQNNEGIDAYTDGLFAESAKFKLDPDTLPLMQALAKAAIALNYNVITNPCGEIVLLLLGGYCVIADVVPFHAQNDDDAEDAFRTATRALIRTNLMDSLYKREVKRTNRIGVGITGFHEWAYARFKFTWHDLVNEEKSKALWLTMSRFKRAIVAEAAAYSAELGVVAPQTDTTFKPAGTTSKLFGLTEGAHLPSMREFVRWVQFRNDDPLVKEYEDKGFPVKHLKTYEGTTVVGFPTKPAICALDGGEWVVTAAEATPEEQYAFLRLLEKYWLTGVAEDGVTPLRETGNQISYTLKYDPKTVTFDRFLETLIEGQFSIRCCSVMPQTDTTAYEYQPEQPVSKAEFEMIARAIQEDNVKEDIGFEHVDCGGGACPIDFNSKAA
jgi:adenosylcobalamin-dependent ribonucleoside-triphosphate reductase